MVWFWTLSVLTVDGFTISFCVFACLLMAFRLLTSCPRVLLGLVQHHGPLRQVEAIVAGGALRAELPRMDSISKELDRVPKWLDLASERHLTQLHHDFAVRLHGKQAVRDEILLPQLPI